MNRVKNRFAVFCLVVGMVAAGPAVAQTAGSAVSPADAKAVMESSAIMNEPLDGSSAEALTASLAKIRQEATEDEFILLRNALGRIRTYDLSVNHNSAKLAAVVNGQTPLEVIEASSNLFQ